MPVRLPKGASATEPPPATIAPRKPAAGATSASSPTTTTSTAGSPRQTSTPQASATQQQPKPSGTGAAAAGAGATTQPKATPTTANPPTREGSNVAAGGGGGKPNPQAQPLRDRILALWAFYEPHKVYRIDELGKALNNDEPKMRGFITEYVKAHGAEPPSKDHAYRTTLEKHYKNDKTTLESTLKLMKDTPHLEPQVFAQLFPDPNRKPAAKAPAGTAAAGGKKLPQPAAQQAGSKTQPGSPGQLSPRAISQSGGAASPTSAASRAATAAAGGGSGVALGGSGEVESRETQTQMKPKSTCDPSVRDRVLAMLATYDPDSLLIFDEDSDIPNTDVGNSFLNSLVDQLGPEPVSKKDAIENLLRRLLEKQDPSRLRSLKTLVSAAVSSNKEVQIVRAMFNAYGMTHKVGRSVASLGLGPSVSQGAMLDFSSGGGGSGITSSLVLSPWTTNVSGSPWSPASSLNSQSHMTMGSPSASSPAVRRHPPLNTKEDLESQLTGAPQVKKAKLSERTPSFSELMVLDTSVGPEPIPQASDLLEKQLGALNPAQAAPVQRCGSENESDPQSRDEATNPFLRGGRKPAPTAPTSLSGISNNQVPFPTAPPQADLGPFLGNTLY